MTRFIIAMLLCFTVAGCATSSHESSIIATARGFAQTSPECKTVLVQYPGILGNAQELASHAPVIAVSFDHDEILTGQWKVSGKSRLNVRILVRIDTTTGTLKSVDVKKTMY
jgi:hypothetical protein